jgi:chromosome segregation ATPase
MARKILSWILIVLSSLFLLLSVVGIAAAWIYNEPLEREALGRLNKIETELQLGQATLENAQMELERALRILDESEQALKKFTDDDPQAFFEDVQSTLNDDLVPELETAKERLVAARNTLEGLRTALAVVRLIPFIQIPVPDQILTDLIDSADSLQTQIKDVEALAAQASTFLSDATFLLDNDLGETRESLEGFLAAIAAYQEKIAAWQDQIADAKEALPTWIDGASVSLTIFLVWFGLSQFSLLLHGRALLRGENPLDVLRS